MERIEQPRAGLPASAPEAAWTQHELNARGVGAVVDDPQDLVADYRRAVAAFRRMTREDEIRAGQRIEEGEREVVEAILGSSLGRQRGLGRAGSPSPEDVDRVVRHLDGLIRSLDDAGDDAERVRAVERQARMSAAGLRALRAAVRRGERKAAAARADLVQRNLPLVLWVARKYRDRGVPFLDLVQEGNIGLITAANKFDYRLGFKFSTYAVWWIRQAVARALGQHGRTIRLPVQTEERVMKVAGARRRLAQRLGREPTRPELASELGMPAAKVEEVMRWARRVVSLDLPIGEDQDATLGELIADPNTELPSAAVMAHELATRTREQMAGLTPREREVLSLRFGIDRDEALTLEEIGKRFGVTRERIRQIEAHALSKLRHPSRAQALRPLAEG